MSKPRRVLLDAGELMQQFQVALEDYVGGTLTYEFSRDMINTLLDHYCYGDRTRMQPMYQVLLQYGVELEQVERAVERCNEMLLRTIQGGFGLIYPNRRYTYSWHTRRTVIVDEHPVFPVATTEDASNDDNGDYVPERLRRR